MPPPLYFAKGGERHAMYEAVHDDATKMTAAWWIKKYINLGFNIIPIGPAMHCCLMHPKNNANVHIFIEEI